MTIISAVSKISIAICSQSQLVQSHKAFLGASHVRAAHKNICIHNFTAQVFVSVCLFVCLFVCLLQLSNVSLHRRVCLFSNVSLHTVHRRGRSWRRTPSTMGFA